MSTTTSKPKREAQIEERLAQMPESYRNCYRKAVSGKSKAAGIKAQCLECVGWQRIEVTLCTDEGCPLWPYRPYRNARTAPEDAS